MKRKNLYFTGLLLVMLMIVTSCEKIGNKATLIAQWEVVKMEVFVYSGEELISQDTYEPEFFMLEFKEDGTLTVYFDPEDLSQYEETIWTHTTDPVKEGDHINIEGDDVFIDSLTERTLVFSFWESASDKLVFTLRKVE